MSDNPNFEKPWRVVGTFDSFEGADQLRNSLISDGYTTRDNRDGKKEVKVSYSSNKSRFLVKAREHEPRPIKNKRRKKNGTSKRTKRGD